MPYDFKLTTTIPASAQDIYEAWLDSLAHSEMTQAEASMSDQVGAEISAWDGYITGRNLELVPGERIVQSWRTSEFSDEHEDSIVTVMLEEIDGGTLLTLIHANVPDEQTSYEQSGWQEYYFEPMKEYFSSGEQAPKKAKSTRAKAKAKRSRKPATAKSRRAAPKSKATSGKSKLKRPPAKKTAAKRVVRAKKKSGRTGARRK